MKIGFNSPAWPSNLQPNGIVKYLDIIKKELDSQGHNCFIFTDHVYGEDNYTNVIDYSQVKFPFQTNTLFSLTIKLFRKLGLGLLVDKYDQSFNPLAFCIKETENLDNSNFEIIEMEESFGAAKRLIKSINTPVIIKLHGPWFLNGDALGVNKDKNFYARVEAEGEAIISAAGITAPSESVLNEVRQYYGLELPNARVIYNPIDKTASDQKWNFDKCIKNQILFVGRFDKHKGGDIVIDAFNILAKNNKHATLVFAGPDRGIVYEGNSISINEYINKKICNEDIQKRIHVLGEVSSNKVNNLRRDSNLTLVASRYETFSYAVIESLEMGCPTIGTKIGGIAEIIINNKTGLFAEVANSNDLAKKISILLGDTGLAINLAKNAVIDIENRFSAENIANETIDYYQHIINESSSIE